MISAKALSLVYLAALLAVGTVFGQEQLEPRNFDARVAFNEGFEVTQSPAQRQAEQALRGRAPGLAVSYHRTSGAARNIHRHGGYLTEPSTAEPRTIAIEFVNAQRELLGLSDDDLSDYEMTDSVLSRVTGTTHLYLRQSHLSIPVYDGRLHVNVNRDGRILSVNSSFSPGLARDANEVRPVRDAPEAVLTALEHLGSTSPPPVVLDGPSGSQQITRMSQPLASREEIVAELVWLPIRAGQVRLAWNFQIHTSDGQHVYDFTVDARTGKVWTRFDWVDSAEYRVYWSDWLALVYTAEPGDLGTDPRGVGSYLFGLSPDDTIRDLPYSTDPAVNNWTYESIQGTGVPHGVGSRWAQALWKVFWALVDKHGFDPDLYDATGGSGNQRALLYVNEGMKNTACSPTFLDARDGVVQTVTDNHGGEDLCTVWEAFAAFGLGVDATTGGPNSLTATNGFALPEACRPDFAILIPILRYALRD